MSSSFRKPTTFTCPLENIMNMYDFPSVDFLQSKTQIFLCSFFRMVLHRQFLLANNCSLSTLKRALIWVMLISDTSIAYWMRKVNHLIIIQYLSIWLSLSPFQFLFLYRWIKNNNNDSLRYLRAGSDQFKSVKDAYGIRARQ